MGLSGTTTSGEAHQQDIAGCDLGGGLRHEVLLAQRPELLAVGDAAIEALGELEWPTGGAGLEMVPIPTAGSAGVVAAYGLQEPAHVLVRPDGYVAHVATRDWQTALRRASAPPADARRTRSYESMPMCSCRCRWRSAASPRNEKAAPYTSPNPASRSRAPRSS